MPISIDAQQWSLLEEAPELDNITTIINSMLMELGAEQSFECSLRLVDSNESAQLNEQYRHKSGPTNVLSFPYEPMPGIETGLLGDLVICAPLVVSQAREQHKTVAMHFTHLVIHGVLHLLGYDHETEEMANEMEAIEIKIMQMAGFDNPYQAIDQS
jgi:probable rRNA maturation factor